MQQRSQDIDTPDVSTVPHIDVPRPDIRAERSRRGIERRPEHSR